LKSLVYNLFIRAGNRGHWPASVKLVTYRIVLISSFSRDKTMMCTFRS